jgi:drug/metabolite transporter (DMT)-like permease
MSRPAARADPATGRLPVRIALGATLVMFLWAVCFPLISVGLSDSPPMTFAALRAVLSGAVLIGAAHVLGRPAVADRSVWGGLVLVGLTATSLGFFGMFYGGGRVSPGLATVIANTQPLIAAVLAWGFLNEHLLVVQRWGLAAGFGGVVLISTPSLSGTESQLSGIGFILVAAVAIAVSNVALMSTGRGASLSA